MAFEVDTPIADIVMFHGEIAYYYRVTRSIDRQKRSIIRSLLLLILCYALCHAVRWKHVHIKQLASMAFDIADAYV